MGAEKRKREEEDVVDVRGFMRWFEGNQYGEIRRVAGLVPDGGGVMNGNVVAAAAGGATTSAMTTGAGGTGAAVAMAGGAVQGMDFLTALKRKHGKVGDETRWQGTVLGSQAADRSVLLEGGPVQHIRDWRPRKDLKVEAVRADEVVSDTAVEEASSAGAAAKEEAVAD